MGVKIVTDSTSDISPEMARELGIIVVPGYVRFGDEVYRDGVDISGIELHDKLAKAKVHPTTSEPTPEDFAKVYSDCAKESQDIISVHVSAKISRICDSANQGKGMARGTSRIEVLDSGLVSVGLALVAMLAAKSAEAGEEFEGIFKKTRQALSQIRMLGVFDGMRGLVLSDRVSGGITALADIANVKPLLTIENGVLVRAGMVRAFSEGVERLYDFVADNQPHVEDLAISYSMVSEQADELKRRISGFFPEERIHLTQLSAALGVHGGPGVLVVALRRGD